MFSRVRCRLSVYEAPRVCVRIWRVFWRAGRRPVRRARWHSRDRTRIRGILRHVPRSSRETKRKIPDAARFRKRRSERHLSVDSTPSDDASSPSHTSACTSDLAEQDAQEPNEVLCATACAHLNLLASVSRSPRGAATQTCVWDLELFQLLGTCAPPRQSACAFFFASNKKSGAVAPAAERVAAVRFLAPYPVLAGCTTHCVVHLWAVPDCSFLCTLDTGLLTDPVKQPIFRTQVPEAPHERRRPPLEGRALTTLAALVLDDDDREEEDWKGPTTPLATTTEEKPPRPRGATPPEDACDHEEEDVDLEEEEEDTQVSEKRVPSGAAVLAAGSDNGYVAMWTLAPQFFQQLRVQRTPPVRHSPPTSHRVILFKMQIFSSRSFFRRYVRNRLFFLGR